MQLNAIETGRKRIIEIVETEENQYRSTHLIQMNFGKKRQ